MADEHQSFERVPYANFGTPPIPPKPRPTSVTVIAIIAIVWGSLGILISLCTLPGLLLSRAGGGAFSGVNTTYTTSANGTTTTVTQTTSGSAPTVSPFSPAYMHDPTFVAYTVADALKKLILSVIAIWSGIALLGLRPAARIWIMRYAIAELLLSGAGLIFYVLLVQPKIVQAMQSAAAQTSGPALPQNMAGLMNASIYIADVFSALLLAWPAAILYVMSRPHVKTAFA